jgi:hypothetical protein
MKTLQKQIPSILLFVPFLVFILGTTWIVGKYPEYDNYVGVAYGVVVVLLLAWAIFMTIKGKPE